VSSHRIVGKCIGILWRSECLLFADVLVRTFQNMAHRVQSCLEANGGHLQRMLCCRHISHTTNVLLFKFRCNIIIGVRIIKEMPGLVGSGTPCILYEKNREWRWININWSHNAFNYRQARTTWIARIQHDSKRWTQFRKSIFQN
jgi:hypothetical protein